MSNYSSRDIRKIRNCSVAPKGFQSTSCKFMKEKRNGEGEGPRVIDILEQLREAVQEKAAAEKETSALRLEISELEYDNATLRRALDETFVKHEQELIELKNINTENREKLFASSTKFLADQKKNVSEIEILRKENEELKANNEVSQKLYKENIQKLENELSKLNGSYEELKEEYHEYLEKSGKYKTKLKYAITMINELNVVLKQMNQKPDCLSVGVQIPEKDCKLDISCGTTACVAPETDDFLLSEIFFKSKHFCENELLRFNSDTSVKM